MTGMNLRLNYLTDFTIWQTYQTILPSPVIENLPTINSPKQAIYLNLTLVVSISDI